MEFKNANPLVVPPGQVSFSGATKETPAFVAPAIVAALVLPLVAGLLAFVGIGLVVWSLGGSVRWALGLAGAAIVGAGLVWMLDAKSLMFSVETLTDRDLNKDGAIGEPKETISIEIYEPQGNRYATFDLPGGAENFGKLVRGLLLGRPFSESNWTGRGRPYSKAEFVELRDVLIERGIIRWRDDKAPAQGCEVTRAGRAVLEQLAQTPQLARTHARASTEAQLLTDGEE